MAQRNPLNERNQGKLTGQTRRSASSAVPARKAANTVILPSATKATKVKPERKPVAPAKNKESFRFNKSKALDPTVKLPAEQAAKIAAKPARVSATPNTPEYKKFRRLYWILIILGIVAVGISFASQQLNYEGVLWMVAMGVAYAVVIAAIVVDIAKVRPIVKKYQREQGFGAKNLSPKQQKHKGV